MQAAAARSGGGATHAHILRSRRRSSVLRRGRAGRFQCTMLILWNDLFMSAASGGGGARSGSGLKATLLRYLWRGARRQRERVACGLGELPEAVGLGLCTEALCLAVGGLAAGLVLPGCAKAWSAHGAGVTRGSGGGRCLSCRGEAAVPLG